MTEWAVVGVLVALAGLFGTLAKPIITLNKTITELTMAVKAIQSDMEKLSLRNSRSHERIWSHSQEQDKRLDSHESRLAELEKREK